MDGRRLDILAKSLAVSDRRQIIRRLGAVAAACLLNLTDAERGSATVLRRPGEICRKDGECASGVCGPKDATGRQRCQYTASSQCPTPTNKCLKAACVAGTCRNVKAVTCVASDQCHDAGICNPSTGVCSNPAKLDGTACDDGRGCSRGEACQNGVCTGGTPLAGQGAACFDSGACCAGLGCTDDNHGKDVCCASGVSCDGVCCAGQGAVCSGAGGDFCCESGVTCGLFCCPAGQTCVDPTNGTCG